MDGLKKEMSKNAFLEAVRRASREDRHGNPWGKEVSEKYHVVELYLEAIENENAPHELLNEVYTSLNRL